MEVFINLTFNLLPLLLLLLAWFTGKKLEKSHFKSITAREKEFLQQPAITAKWYHGTETICASDVALGSVVVSVDHFKRFLMGFRRIFGGEIRSYSPLIDRGRREALLRMKESHPQADMFLNCRLETSTISNGKGKSTGCVEIVAYATALYFEKV